jgi:hypothetical protein
MLVPTGKVIEAFRPLSPSAEALLTLSLDACRWPLDGPRWCCGKPAVCGSYCTEHDRDSRILEIKRLSPRTSGPMPWSRRDYAPVGR